MSTVIKVEGLCKAYGLTVAIDQVDLEVQEGEIFGMVGPNGAGKTTTIECLEGLRKPDRGKIEVLGVNPHHDGHFLHLHTGMQLQQSNLPERMKVWETLDLYSSFYPNPANWEELLEQLGLGEKRNSYFGKLSGGQKQRLFIALALLPNPQLIFLDELTTGLDPHARHVIWDLIRGVRLRGKTILLTTHYMEEAELLCDRVAILDHGRVVAMNTPAELIRSYGFGESLTFTADTSLPAEFINAMENIGRLDIQEGKYFVHGATNPSTMVSDVVLLLARLGISFRNIHSEQSTLEDVFMKLTGREMRD